MRFLKNMTITMTINELNDLYSGDPLQTLLANFNKIYASKCYGGSLIEIGNRIVRHGLVTCNDDGESYYVPI